MFHLFLKIILYIPSLRSALDSVIPILLFDMENSSFMIMIDSLLFGKQHF